MPESQATPQATPQQETSQPQAQPQAASQPEPQRQVEPPRKLAEQKKPKVRDQAKSDGDAQRAEQIAARAAAEKKNPFSPANRSARMDEVMKKLRNERGVAEPQTKEPVSDKAAKVAGSGDVPSGAAEPGGKPGDGVPPQNDVKSTASDNDAPPDWYKREQAAQAQERRAQDALANAERERANIEKVRADADAAVQRLADAKDDPIEFMAQAGMTKDEWQAFLSNGGTLTPEQKKLKSMAENMAKMQERLDKAESQAVQQRQEAQRVAEEAGFASDLAQMTYVPQMGGIQAVRARQHLLTQKTGQAVTLRDAAQHLEQEMSTGLERLLQNPKIRSSLKLDVNTSPAGQAAETPRTLNNAVSSQQSQADARPHPLDFAAKRKLWAQRVARDQETRTGR